MPYNNFLHLLAADLDKPVYRIMPLKRLIECLVVKKLTLLKPKKWDDPFENWLLSATVEAASGELGTMQPIRNAVFGLCWTLHRETDAMWRIYSPKSDYQVVGAVVASAPQKNQRIQRRQTTLPRRLAVSPMWCNVVKWKTRRLK